MAVLRVKLTFSPSGKDIKIDRLWRRNPSVNIFLLKSCLRVCSAGIPKRLDLHVGGAGQAGDQCWQFLSSPLQTLFCRHGGAWWRSAVTSGKGLWMAGSTGAKVLCQACWSSSSIKYMPPPTFLPSISTWNWEGWRNAAGSIIQPLAIQSLRNNTSGWEMLFPKLHLNVPLCFYGEGHL